MQRNQALKIVDELGAMLGLAATEGIAGSELGR
jgi:hypothetical protein